MGEKKRLGLILSAYYTPLEGLAAHFDGSEDELISGLSQWAITEEAGGNCIGTMWSIWRTWIR